MLCVPRSCAASPCVIERMTVILSATWAVFGSGLAELLALDLGGDRPHLAAVLDRGERLGVERLLVGDAAGEEDVDDRVGLGGDRRVILQVGAGPEPEEVAEGQAEPGRSDRQESSATESAPEVAFSHRSSPFHHEK